MGRSAHFAGPGGRGHPFSAVMQRLDFPSGWPVCGCGAGAGRSCSSCSGSPRQRRCSRPCSPGRWRLRTARSGARSSSCPRRCGRCASTGSASAARSRRTRRSTRACGGSSGACCRKGRPGPRSTGASVRRRAAQPRRRRRPRPLGAPSLGPASARVPAAALRGARRPSGRPDHERAGPAARAGRRGRPAHRDAVRRRDPGPGSGRVGLRGEDPPLPPAGPAAARARERRRRARPLAGVARRLPQLRLGGAAAARDRALLVGLGAGDPDRAVAYGLSGIELRLRADGADDELLAAADSARVAGRRLLLLGGEAVALLLSFAVLVAARQRPTRRHCSRGLVPRGSPAGRAGRGVVESLFAAAAGTVLGWLAGRPLLPRSPAGATSRRVRCCSIRCSRAAGSGSRPPLPPPRRWWWRLALVIEPLRLGGLALSPLDVAAIGAALAVVIAWHAARRTRPSCWPPTGRVSCCCSCRRSSASPRRSPCARLLPLALRGLRAPRSGERHRAAARGARPRPPSWLRGGRRRLRRGLGRLRAVRVGLPLTLVAAQRQEAAFAVPSDEIVARTSRS